MKMLLDTNVWRYLVDSGEFNHLYPISKKNGIKIVICPAVVIETLKMSNIELRDKIIELQTRRYWKRLMPDAYLECHELKMEIMRTHPEWIMQDKNINRYRKLKSDWTRDHGGWWSKVRKNPDTIAEHYKFKNDRKINHIRKQSQIMRQSVIESKKNLANEWLTKIEGSMDSIDGEVFNFEGWRVYCSEIWKNLLNDEAVQQWLGCEIDIYRILTSPSGYFRNFWLYEADAKSLARAWLRFAFFALQADRKVTDGNPLDSTIGTHIIDADVVITADKNFSSMINRCFNEAPFITAKSELIAGGNEGVDQLFNLITDGISISKAN